MTPLVLMVKFATPAQDADGRINAIAAYLFGIGVAGAIAPYFTILLKNRDPLLPMLLASVALAVTTLALRNELIMRKASAAPLAQPAAGSKCVAALPMLAAVGLFAFGMQVHTAINSANIFVRAAPETPLAWLLPLYWAGFSLAMTPASQWHARSPEFRAGAPRLPPIRLSWPASSARFC